METMLQGRLSVDSAARVADISPLLFGHFIEFMYDCIDEGMWAQLLQNRGFEGAPSKDGTCEGWALTGMLNHFSYTLDDNVFYGREGHSQRIWAANHYGNGYRGIAQKGLRLFADAAYEGYAWLRTDAPCRASVCVHDPDRGTLAEEFFDVTDAWQKCALHVTTHTATRCAVFEVRLHGNGTLWVDQASLMPQSTVHGVWPRVIEAARALKAPIVRFPGGCFADCYHWRDGVGPRDERPVRPNAHWGGLEDNSFGTDEYMKFCAAVGCEPMICINFGTGTPEEAADWVEYCNGAPETPMGRLRAENGHPQPYGVKYWDIGNETFGDWEIGHCNADEYAARYTAFTSAMRAKDEGLVFLACGGDANYTSQEWNETIVKKLGDNIDILCLHMYPPQIKTEVHENGDIYHAVVGAVQHYERVLADTLRVVETCCQSAKKPRVAVTEWNAGYNNSEAGREQTMEAAVFNAGLLILFLQNAGNLALCNYSDLVNGWGGGCIRSKDGEVFGTASYHMLKLFAAAELTHTVAHSINSPAFGTTVRVGNVQPMQNVPYLDAVAAKDAQGRTVIFAVNRHMQRSAELTIELNGAPLAGAECLVITAPEASDYNTLQNECIRATPLACPCSGSVTLPPHSVVKILAV